MFRNCILRISRLSSKSLINSHHSARTRARDCSFSSLCRSAPNIAVPKSLLFVSSRSKHKKKTPKNEVEDEEEEENEEFDEPGSKVITGHMTSLRADLVLKSGLGISRNKIETLFYESKIRVNGKKILKKSYNVAVGDEVDLLKEPSPKNDAIMTISRVVVLSAKEHEDGDKLVVKMRRFKSLAVENNETEF